MPNLSPTLLLQPKDRPSAAVVVQLSSLSTYTPSPQTKLEPPPPRGSAQVKRTPGAQQDQKRDEFYVNLGLAVRTLREDLPLIFTKDLNYDIYR